jgi:hypothetical protein
MAKRTKGEMVELIEQVKLLIIKGNVDYAIVKTLMKLHNVGDRQARKYVDKAHSELTESTKMEVEKHRNQSIKRYNYLFNKAIEAGQVKTALSVLVQLDKITGASHPEVVKHQIEMTPTGDGKPAAANGFLAMIVNAREGAAALEEEMIERYRKERNAE